MASITLERRVTRLEVELAESHAQAERASIEHDASIKELEERYMALLTEHTANLNSNNQLQSFNDKLQQEVTSLRERIHEVQEDAEEKATAADRKVTEVQTLRSEKRALDRYLESKQADIAELEQRIQSHQAMVKELRDEDARLLATILEVRRERHRTEQEKALIEEQNGGLKQTISWLEEQSKDLEQTLHSVQTRSREEVNGLQSKLEVAEQKIWALEKSENSLKSQLASKEQSSKALVDEMIGEHERVVKDNQELEKQLAAAQELSALFKENSEYRTAENQELQHVIRDLRSHVEEMTSAHETAITHLEEAVANAEARLKAEKAKAASIQQAALSGRFGNGIDLSPDSAIPEGGRGAQGEEAGSLPTATAGMSKTELFSRLSDVTAEWQRLTLQNKQNEIILEGVVSEMEKRGAAMREQEAEYERVQQAYSSMLGALDLARNERRLAESAVLDLEGEVRSCQKTIRVLQNQVKDSGRQIVVLLNEQQRLTGGSSRQGTPQPRGFGSPTGVSDGLNGYGSQAIVLAGNDNDSSEMSQEISRHITFTNIQELQEKNESLQTLVRNCTEALESSQAEVRAEMEAQHEIMQQKHEAELDHLRQQREEQTAIVKQIVEQRDMYRKLLQDAASGSKTAAGDLQLVASASSPRAEPKEVQDAGYTKGFMDAERESARKLEEAAQNAKLMSGQVAKAKGDASWARTELARAKADYTFAKQSIDRLSARLSEQDEQLSMNAKFASQNQETIASLQDRLSKESAQLQTAQIEAKTANHKLRDLQNEKQILDRQINRLKTELKEESAARNALEAEFRAAKKEAVDAETEHARQMAALRAKVSAAELAQSQAEERLRATENRSKDFQELSKQAREDANQRVAAANELVKKAKEAESLSLQKIAELNGKIEVLERTRSDRHGSRLRQAGNETGGIVTEQRQAQARKILESELQAALEAAAKAATDVAQYRTLAEESGKSLTDLQAEFQRVKDDLEKNVTEQATEIRILQEIVQDKQEAVDQLEKTADAWERLRVSQIEDQNHAAAEFHSKMAEKEELLRKASAEMEKLEETARTYRQKFEDAESRAQAEVDSHAETVRQLQAAERSLQLLEGSNDARMESEQIAKQAQKDAEDELEVLRARLNAKVREAENKLEEIQKQNKVLHESLQKKLQGRSTSGEDGGDLAEVISFLRHKNEVLEAEKQLSVSQAERLQNEIDVLRKTVSSVKAQLALESTRQQQAEQEEALFEERRRHQAEQKILMENNTTLRSENEYLTKLNATWKSKLEKMEAQLAPQEQTIIQLKADLESMQQEIRMKSKEAENWERRATSLRTKNGTVDVEDYEEVQKQLQELSASSVPRVELAKVQERVKELEATMRSQVGKEYHDSELKGLNGQIAALKKSLQQEQSRLAIRDSEIISLKQAASKLEQEKVKVDTAHQKVVRWMRTANPDRLPLPDFKAQQNREKLGLKRAEEYEEALKEVVDSEISPSAVVASIRSYQNKLRELQANAQGSQGSSAELSSLQSSLAQSQSANAALQQEQARNLAALADAEKRVAQLQNEAAEFARTIARLEADILSLQAKSPASVPSTSAPTLPLSSAGLTTSTAPQSASTGLAPLAPQAASLAPQAAPASPIVSPPVPAADQPAVFAGSAHLLESTLPQEMSHVEGAQPESSEPQAQPQSLPPSNVPMPVASLPQEGLIDLPPPDALEPLLATARPALEPLSTTTQPLLGAAGPSEPTLSREGSEAGADFISLDPPKRSHLEHQSGLREPEEAEDMDAEMLQPHQPDLSPQTEQPLPDEPSRAQSEPAPVSEDPVPSIDTRLPEVEQVIPERDGPEAETQKPTDIDLTEANNSVPAVGESKQQTATPVALPAEQPVSSQPPSQPSSLNPNAAAFNPDFVRQLREQALQKQIGKAEGQTSMPASTQSPLAIPSPSTETKQDLDGERTRARHLAGEAAVKRQQDAVRTLPYQPPAKRARQQRDASDISGISAVPTGTAGSSLNERQSTDPSQVDLDLADDAQSSSSDEFVAVGAGQEGAGGQGLGDDDDDDDVQDMPFVPGSPVAETQPEDPTQPPSQQQASPERDVGEPSGPEKAEESGQQTRKRRQRPIIWNPGSMTGKKDDETPPGGATGRGRGKRASRGAR